MSIGVYPNLVNSTSSAAKTEVKALLTTFSNLFPTQSEPSAVTVTGSGGSGSIAYVGSVSGNTSTPSPEFDRVVPAMVIALQAELTAIALAITNGA